MLAHTSHGISKVDFHRALTTRFSLSPEDESACEKYYILHWQGSHFKHVMHNGIITHQNTDYLVVYCDCTPAVIKTDSRLYMSFRKPLREWQLAAYVLVSIGG